MQPSRAIEKVLGLGGAVERYEDLTKLKMSDAVIRIALHRLPETPQCPGQLPCPSRHQTPCDPHFRMELGGSGHCGLPLLKCLGAGVFGESSELALGFSAVGIHADDLREDLPGLRVPIEADRRPRGSQSRQRILGKGVEAAFAQGRVVNHWVAGPQ